jgi:hypothetical protein
MILIDNDSGAKEIKKKLDVKDLAMPFFHYGETYTLSLYLLIARGRKG